MDCRSDHDGMVVWWYGGMMVWWWQRRWCQWLWSTQGFDGDQSPSTISPNHDGIMMMTMMAMLWSWQRCCWWCWWWRNYSLSCVRRDHVMTQLKQEYCIHILCIQVARCVCVCLHALRNNTVGIWMLAITPQSYPKDVVSRVAINVSSLVSRERQPEFEVTSG